MSAPVVRWAGVAKHYGDPEQMVLRGVNLAVGAGDFVAIMGPSGSGKTTLLNILGLVDTATAGTVELCGRDITRPTRRQSLQARRAISSVFQEFYLLGDRGVVDNVALPLLYRGVSREAARDRAAAALESVGVGPRAHATANQLSGGQRQRVAIARAMVIEPRLLICDEPTGSLDEATAAGVLELIRAAARQGSAVVMVTHDPAAARWAGRTLSLEGGLLMPGETCRGSA